jgi:uncharacterized protein
MNDFTPARALIGGALIGLSASLFLLTHGKVAGVSGLFAGLARRDRAERRTSTAFVAGLLLVGLVAGLVAPQALGGAGAPLGWTAVAGLLVGFGTRLGNGCTSGHGVCGVSRLSIRSLLATATFLVAGMATVAAVRALGGGT